MHQPSPHDDSTTDTQNPTRQPSTLAQLRALSPNRLLTDEEIPAVAEAQAKLLIRLNNVTRPPVPANIITALPRIEVVQDPKMPDIAGATVWHGSRWLIVLNGRDRLTRRRITLAHEFKHIIDHAFGDTLYACPDGHRPNNAYRRSEQAAEYFAGFLLMPEPMIRSAWIHGVQSLSELAELFEVSQRAMAARLQMLDLGEHLWKPYVDKMKSHPLDATRHYHLATTRKRSRRYWRATIDHLARPSRAVTCCYYHLRHDHTAIGTIRSLSRAEHQALDLHQLRRPRILQEVTQ